MIRDHMLEIGLLEQRKGAEQREGQRSTDRCLVTTTTAPPMPVPRDYITYIGQPLPDLCFTRLLSCLYQFLFMATDRRLWTAERLSLGAGCAPCSYPSNRRSPHLYQRRWNGARQRCYCGTRSSVGRVPKAGTASWLISAPLYGRHTGH